MLKVTFESPRFSGEQLFAKDAAGQKLCDAFLKSLANKTKGQDKVKVQIAHV